MMRVHEARNIRISTTRQLSYPLVIETVEEIFLKLKPAE